MKRKTFFLCLIFVLLFSSLSLVSEASQEWVKERTYITEPPYVIGFSNSFMGISWRTQFMAEFNNAVKSYGPIIKDVYVTNADNNIAKQIADVEDLLAKRIDGLVINPVSPTALVPIIEKAYKMGIPVVVINDKINTENYSAYRSTDDVEFGRVGAQWLVDELNGKGKIVALSGTAGQGVCDDRWTGATSVFDRYPGIEIVAHEYADWSYDTAKMAMQNVVAANPTIDGIWSGGGAMSRAAIDVFLEAGRELVPMTSEDENGFLKKWYELRDQGFTSIAASKPTWITRVGVEALLDLLQGIPVPKKLIYPCPVITEDNLEEYVNFDLPDTYWANSLLFEKEVKELLKGQ